MLKEKLHRDAEVGFEHQTGKPLTRYPLRSTLYQKLLCSHGCCGPQSRMFWWVQLMWNHSSSFSALALHHLVLTVDHAFYSFEGLWNHRVKFYIIHMWIFKRAATERMPLQSRRSRGLCQLLASSSRQCGLRAWTRYWAYLTLQSLSFLLCRMGMKMPP